MVILGEARIHAPTPRGNTSIDKLATTTVVNVARGLVPRWGRGGAWQNPPCQISVPSHSSGSSYLGAPAQSGRMLNVEIQQANNTRKAYAQRIEDLHNEAALDGIEVNAASERDFWSFVTLGDPDRRAGVMLLDNGNFRAVWKGDDATHVGLQFLGDGRAEYVIFKRRPATTDISRVAGNDTLEGIKRQIHTFDLTSLIEAWSATR